MDEQAFIADWQQDLRGGCFLAISLLHPCRHLRCPERQASATGGSSSSHLSHLLLCSLAAACLDSCLARLAAWMNELKWRVSEWVPGGSCGWGAALGQGRAGLGAVQAKPRQLWGLGGRRGDPQLGKSSSSSHRGIQQSNRGITRQDFCTTYPLRIHLTAMSLELQMGQKDIPPSMG